MVTNRCLRRACLVLLDGALGGSPFGRNVLVALPVFFCAGFASGLALDRFVAAIPAQAEYLGFLPFLLLSSCVGLLAFWPLVPEAFVLLLTFPLRCFGHQFGTGLSGVFGGRCGSDFSGLWRTYLGFFAWFAEDNYEGGFKCALFRLSRAAGGQVRRLR